MLQPGVAKKQNTILRSPRRQRSRSQHEDPQPKDSEELSRTMGCWVCGQTYPAIYEQKSELKRTLVHNENASVFRIVRKRPAPRIETRGPADVSGAARRAAFVFRFSLLRGHNLGVTHVLIG